MKAKNIIGLAFLVLIHFACSENFSRDYELNSRLVLTDSLTIYLPDSVPHIASLTRPLYNTTGDLFSYVTDEAGLLKLYSYDKDLATWKLTTLNKNGPNQVYQNGAFNLINDKIIFFPFNLPRVIKLDDNGNKIWDKEYFQNREMAFDSKVKNPVIHDDGQNIFFDLGSYVNFDNPGTFERTNTVGKFNYSEGEFNSIIKYPEEFHDKTWSGNDAEHQLIIRDDLLYMNFVKSEFIYVYDKEGKLVNKGLVKTSHIKNAKGKKSEDSMQNAIEQINNGHYAKVIYDPWRDVFYRIGVYFDVDYEVKSVQDVANAFRNKKLAILTFDKDLNVLANDEFSATANRLNEYYHWVNEDGLYLYQSPVSMSENIYQFAKFSLNKLLE